MHARAASAHANTHARRGRHAKHAPGAKRTRTANRGSRRMPRRARENAALMRRKSRMHGEWDC
ncbi:hypothetical protein C7S16_3284 [Burkholderia thailandensis]|uniref:Uncharacterized protein n=1 Tax=Burkholderia thailandensis TaxID=57975 RepID=A0AAW9D6K4_BURTH|nr:hypothetical protein [Burkholderia thailandensis]MDW9257446.1 hypothetical protein [Burkholderia thailandensis]